MNFAIVKLRVYWQPMELSIIGQRPTIRRPIGRSSASIGLLKGWSNCLHLEQTSHENHSFGQFWHSSVGVSPFQALYGRTCRLPLQNSQLGTDATDHRVHTLLTTWRDVWRNICHSRKANEQRMVKRPEGAKLKVGDSALLRKPGLQPSFSTAPSPTHLAFSPPHHGQPDNFVSHTYYQSNSSYCNSTSFYTCGATYSSHSNSTAFYTCGATCSSSSDFAAFYACEAPLFIQRQCISTISTSGYNYTAFFNSSNCLTTSSDTKCRWMDSAILNPS